MGGHVTGYWMCWARAEEKSLSRQSYSKKKKKKKVKLLSEYVN